MRPSQAPSSVSRRRWFSSGSSKPPAAPSRPHRDHFGVSASSNTAAATAATAAGVTKPPTNSRDERSLARQTAEAAGTILVDGVVVQPAYRSTPWEAEARHAATAQDKALVMFVSESGICRGPLAAAAFSQLLQHSPLRTCLTVACRASRDYCEGQPPDHSAAAAADTLGFSLTGQPQPLPTDSDTAAAAAAAAAAAEVSNPSPSSSSSSNGEEGSGGVVVFDPLADIVAADLVLVMDKYTAADVLREVSSYDLINPGGRYSSRVRMLGSFHPQLASQTQTPDGQDIDDALYGNEGGQEEQEEVLSAARLIVESCRNLLQYLEDLAASNGLLPLPQPNTTATTTSSSSCSSSGGSNGAAASGSSSSNNGSSTAEGGGAVDGSRFKAVLSQHVQEEGVIEWLVPPMLQGSNVDLDGWV